jgi:hypothetical protein
MVGIDCALSLATGWFRQHVFKRLRKHQDVGNGITDVAVGPSGEVWAAVDRVGRE